MEEENVPKLGREDLALRHAMRSSSSLRWHCREDARVGLLEAVFIVLTLKEGRSCPSSVTHSSRIGATLPLRLGGLGLRSAFRLRYAAHWASWADCIHSDGSSDAPHRGPYHH